MTIIPKNVIIVSFDDAVAFWKYKKVFGEELRTPNLDKICAQSTAFHSAYCQAPVCSPSRASFMSGLAPHQSGVTGPYKNYFEKIPPQKMWPYRLKEAGYYCSSGGKMMRGFLPLPLEIHEAIYDDESKFFKRDIGLPPRKTIRFGGFRDGKAAKHLVEDGRFYDFQSSSSAITFIDSYDREEPFYREVGFFGPHGPWITPRRFKEMYNEDGFQIPKAWQNGFDGSEFVDKNSPKNFSLKNIEFWAKSVRNYFSSLSHADYHLGRVWDALKASKHADNTIMVIVADHGHHLGERDRFRKSTLWEQVANVPLVIHDPDNPVAQTVSDPVALLDVGPTVMDYLGLEPISSSVGRSLKPLMEWERDPDRAIPTFLHGSASVRKGKYRFIRYEDGSTQFFDLSKDWWQTTDLGPQHPEYGHMKIEHAKCCKEYGMELDLAA